MIGKPEDIPSVLAVYAIGQVMGLQDGADNGKADSCSQTPAALMLTALISFPDNFSILFGNGRSGIGYGNSAAVSCDSDAFAICGVINGIYTPREAVDYLDGIQATIQ